MQSRCAECKSKFGEILSSFCVSHFEWSMTRHSQIEDPRERGAPSTHGSRGHRQRGPPRRRRAHARARRAARRAVAELNTHGNLSDVVCLGGLRRHVCGRRRVWGQAVESEAKRSRASLPNSCGLDCTHNRGTLSRCGLNSRRQRGSSSRRFQRISFESSLFGRTWCTSKGSKPPALFPDSEIMH